MNRESQYFINYKKYKTEYIDLKKQFGGEKNIIVKEDKNINIAFANITIDGFIGEGHYIDEKKEDIYYLYTTGLIGCVGLFITFKYKGKKLVWLSHVADGIEDFPKLFENIWSEIGKLISKTDLKYDDAELTDLRIYLVANRNILRDTYSELTEFIKTDDIVGHEVKDIVDYKGIAKKPTVQLIEEYLSSIELDYTRLYGNSVVYEFKKYKPFRGDMVTISTIFAGLSDFAIIERRLEDINRLIRESK